MGILSRLLNLFKDPNKIDKKQKLELFDISEYDRPGYLNYKKCPNCSADAKTNKEVQDLFGVMRVKGHVYIQSWCRKCRSTKKEQV